MYTVLQGQLRQETPDDQKAPDNDRYSKLKYLMVEYPLQHLIS